MTVYPAERAEPGPAVVYCPGGAYKHLTPRPELIEWLNDSGITVFMLKYSVPDDREAAFRDVQRAVRVVRHNAAQWNVDPRQLGVIGSSSGGHGVKDVDWHPACREWLEGLGVDVTEGVTDAAENGAGVRTIWDAHLKHSAPGSTELTTCLRGAKLPSERGATILRTEDR